MNNDLNQVTSNDVNEDINNILNAEEDKTNEEEKLSKKKNKVLKKTEKSKIKQSKKNKGKNVRKANIDRYEADPGFGLTDQAVSQRVEEGYVNVSKTGSTKSIKRIILTNIFTFFNLLTIAIAGWLISVKAFTDLFFIVIVTANVVIGIIQEIKAKNTIDKLSLMQAPTSYVMRNGERKEIGVNEVVLDDILILEQGKQIAADAIVVSGAIEVNESLLTGESDAIVKKPGDVLYSGSFVVSGNCKARVDKVGSDNYIEQLTGEAKLYKKPKSDLLRSLRLIIFVMALIIIPIGGLLFYMQYFQGGVDYITAVRKTAGAMIGMIPSGLFLLSSVALAVGVIRLAQNNVMVQELYCIEMLARVNVLCLDKTGTITDGTMSVKNVVEYNTRPDLSTKNIISAMLNALDEKNLTAIALEEKFGKNKRLRVKALIPFSSQRKLNAVQFEKFGTFIMGAPEFVMKKEYASIQNDVEKYAEQGYRVLLLAHNKGDIDPETQNLPEGSNTVIAMVLIEDNIRPDAIKTISYFRESGVEVKVISGDNPITVSKISERAGIENASEYISLDGLSDEEVVRAASKYTVFGRVSPNQKRLLIQTLKSENKTVAMTGDGVNDILALKEADCSIAVASGSEAARNVSHLVLLDSNFDSMPKVVAEGRRVINNVAAVACLFLTKTIFSLLLALQAINSGGVYPISTNQLIMIDLFVTGIPSTILILEPNNKEVDGRFLVNIFKGAIPGAIVILIASMIAFKLVDYLGLDFMTSSTIIVIVATHTCLMVLFKVCRPFNLLRKVLCTISYSLFLLIALFMPNFFEFRPILPFMEYHSDTLETKYITDIPSVSISEAWYYVLDDEVTDVRAHIDQETYQTGSAQIGDEVFLTINGNVTNWKIPTKVLSVDKDNNIYATGTNTKILYTADENHSISFEYSKDGFVTIVRKDLNTNKVEKIETNFNIIPQVAIAEGKLVFDGMIQEDLPTHLRTINSVEINPNPDSLELIINGELYTYTNHMGEKATYKIAAPSISINSSNEIVLGAKNTNLSLSKDFPQYESLSELIEKEKVTISGNEYKIGDRETGCLIAKPTIKTSKAGYYIINGKYTNYKAKQIGGDTATNLNFTEKDNKAYLTINGLQTDIEVNIAVQVGGMVQALSIQAILILVSLCLMASPLMKIINGIVPWVKSAFKFSQDLLNKF